MTLLYFIYIIYRKDDSLLHREQGSRKLVKWWNFLVRHLGFGRSSMRLLALFIFVPRLRGQTREQWLSPVVYLTSIILNQTIDPNNKFINHDLLEFI